MSKTTIVSTLVAVYVSFILSSGMHLLAGGAYVQNGGGGENIWGHDELLSQIYYVSWNLPVISQLEKLDNWNSSHRMWPSLLKKARIYMLKMIQYVAKFDTAARSVSKYSLAHWGQVRHKCVSTI